MGYSCVIISYPDGKIIVFIDSENIYDTGDIPNNERISDIVGRFI